MLRQRLKHGMGVWYIEALCQGVTVGFSEVLIIIWYSRQVKDAVSLGLILTLPAAIGAITQALATRKKSFARNPLKLASASIVTQIFGLVTIALGLQNPDDFNIVLIAGQCLYWMGSMTATSPTQEILAQTVPAQQHNRFFSRRAIVMTIVTLGCNILAAVLLDRGLNPVMMIRFVLAAAAMRLLSLSLLVVKGTPRTGAAVNAPVAAKEPSHEVIVSIFKLSLCIALFRCAVNISSPFFSAYMLKDMGFSFGLYSIMTAVPLITKTLCLNNWARLLDDKKIFEGLAIATFLIGLGPILCALTKDLVWFASIQVMSGISWSGFDLISVLLIQNMYPRSITSKLGLFLAFGSLGSVTGSVIGGLILNHSGSFITLFHLSGVTRLMTGFLLLWYLRRNHLFRFHHLNLKHGLATLMTVRPSIEAAAKLIPLPQRRRDKRNRQAS